MKDGKIVLVKTSDGKLHEIWDWELERYLKMKTKQRKGGTMLFKVCMQNWFAEPADRIGVIEAATIQDAAQRLIRWNAEEVDWGDCVPSDPLIHVLGPDQAMVSYQVKDTADDKERKGAEVYIIRPIGSDILMYLAQDWNLVFD